MKYNILLIACSLIVMSCSSTKKKVATTQQSSTDNTVAVADKMSKEEKTTYVINKNTSEKPASVAVKETPAVLPVVPKTVIETTIEEEVVAQTPPAPRNPAKVAIIEHETILEEPQLDHAALHSPFDTLLNNNVSSEGNVNYNGFKSNRRTLTAYITALGENLPEDSWTKDEKLSYWMNAYNAMTVDLILRNQPIASIKDIKKPWDQRLWKLGDKWYNLEEIEHAILRKMGDPRIQFGINCASVSCPPLLNEAFVPSKVDSQLNIVATNFVNDKSRNTISEDSVQISKIFNWFSKDFTQNGSIVDYLNKYATVKISKNAKVRYMDYNWELNK